MKEYKRILSNVLINGEEKIGRNGKTYSITGEQFRHDMRKGFPILTIRQMSLKHSITELRFFLQGLQDVRWLQERGCKFWDKWRSKFPDYNLEDDKGVYDLGPIYGSQWRNFNGRMIEGEWSRKGPDQLKEVIETLKTNPLSRRMLVSAWNPIDIEDMALPPCHDSFQFISNGKDLDLIWRQRSCDTVIGLPYDILLYALLLQWVAIEVNMNPRFLVGQLGDVHIYEEHMSGIEELLSREPKILPELIWEKHSLDNILEWVKSDELTQKYRLSNYLHHPKMKFEVKA